MLRAKNLKEGLLVSIVFEEKSSVIDQYFVSH